MRMLLALVFVSGCFVGESAHAARLLELEFDADGDGTYDALRGGDDCDDGSDEASPLTLEVCDGIDNNCDGEIDEGLVMSGYVDVDGDGHGTGELVEFCEGETGYADTDLDCDDNDPDKYVGAFEECDAIDNDCDGIVDNIASSTWYADADGDGYGDSADTIDNCPGEVGYVANDLDCADDDSAVNPAAHEACDDGIDNNCDGIVDDDSPDLVEVYTDADLDGFGDGTSFWICGDLPAGTSLVDGDCDDATASTNPDADDVCGNFADDNCSGFVDDGDDAAWYLDDDGDGFGSTGLVLNQCDAPGPEWVNNSDDCNDSIPAINPDAIETCNGIDDDCVGGIDDNPPVAVWWADADGDGFGNLSAPSDSCSPDPTTHVQNTQDCDDGAADVNPSSEENCSNETVDNDCDGDAIDTPVDPTTWYPDVDGDGYGEIGGATVVQCSAPANTSADSTDCDDSAIGVNPGETEICNSIDDDCSGDIDSDATDKTTHYLDDDFDGYGDPAESVQACGISTGISATNDDCDDDEGTIYPGATEFCNGVDDDCNTLVDDGSVVPATWYRDEDGDGYGLLTDTIDACTQPAGYILDSRDCDDVLDFVNPGMPELCSTVGVDDDCSGTPDEVIDAIDTTNYYVDGDTDGYGELGSPAVPACSAPVGFVTDNTDCDDAVNATNPGADELCSTVGVDDNCVGGADENTAVDAGTYYPDLDDDGYGDLSDSGEIRCVPTAVQVLDNTDCNDGVQAINPGEDELCSTVGIDDNCAGGADEGTATDALVWYLDDDSDSYGLTSSATDACTAPAKHISTDGDCDDVLATVNPGEDELCSTIGVDDNCSGLADENTATDAGTWYDDIDDDNYGDENDSGEVRCVPTATQVADNTDCDDGTAGTNPGADELCSTIGVDDDCDSSIDEASATDVPTWYFDDDGDSYGLTNTTSVQCVAPTDYVSANNDCDDTDASINPGQTTLACDDSSDLNCDTVVDNDGDGDSYSLESCGGTDCDDTDSGVNPGIGNCAAYVDCWDAMDQGETVDGMYTIDPDGVGGSASFSAYCDITGGGWTQVFCDDMSTALDSGWNEQTTTTCGSYGTILGGVNVSAQNDTISNTISMLGIAHSDVRVDFDFIKVDSWDGESGFFDFENSNEWSQSYSHTNGVQECGSGGAGSWLEETDSQSFDFAHTGSTALIEFYTTLNQDANDESFGVDNVCVWVNRAGDYIDCYDALSQGETVDGNYTIDPDGVGGNAPFTVYCDITGGGWTEVFCDDMSTSLDSGWSPQTTTSCGGFGTILGGYDTTGVGATISNTIDLLGITHNEIRTEFDWIKIDSWDNEPAYYDLDSSQEWTTTYAWDEGTQICGSTSTDFNEVSESVSVTSTHSATTALLEFSSTNNQAATNESFGVDNVCVSVNRIPAPPVSCKEILDNGDSTGDGTYTIDPGTGSISAYCDMTWDGGGWTLVGVKTSNGSGIWSSSWNSTCANQTTGNCASAVHPSMAWDDYMFRFSDTTDYVVWYEKANGVQRFTDYLNGTTRDECASLSGWNRNISGTTTLDQTIPNNVCYRWDNGISELKAGSDQWINIYTSADTSDNYASADSGTQGHKCIGGYCRTEPIWMMVR